ncbi:hypothetical protein [Rhizobium sp. M1]|uniref:hypothetical protein n=1 Tax=Rhizobium sp. M1 TaxID=2035453 RepID=UPI001FDFA5DA|nr:hypothetical protein [Rhizobium sp. M1]
MKVGSALLNVANDKARAIRPHAELHIDRVQELAELGRRHFFLWGDRKMSDDITAALYRRERLSVVKCVPVAG